MSDNNRTTFDKEMTDRGQEEVRLSGSTVNYRKREDQNSMKETGGKVDVRITRKMAEYWMGRW